MVLVNLFFEFLKIGAFSFGGGMATLPYVYEMAGRTNWIKAEEVTNILSVSQATPGPLACNIGTIVGMNAHGIIGSFIANIAFVLPAICFMGICFKMIKKIQSNNKANDIIKLVRVAALSAMITSSLTLYKSAFFVDNNLINIKAITLGIIIFFVSRIKKIPTIGLMIASTIVAGIIVV